MSMVVTTQAIATPSGERTALVLTPADAIVVPATAGLDIRPGVMTETDHAIAQAARDAATRGNPTVCIFRARDPEGGGSYAFDPNMSEETATGLASRMLAGQVLVYREMLQLGICLFLHTDLGPVEAQAYRTAVDRRVEELAELVDVTINPDPHDQVDLWLLRNLSFFFTLRFEKLTQTILPEKLTLMEKRMDRIHRLAASLRGV